MTVISLPWRDLAFGDGPAINTSLAPVETARLQQLAAGNRVLEVGSAYGYSTVALGLVAEHVVAIDPHRTHGSHGALLANLSAYGVSDRVDVRVGYSEQVLPELAGDRFDLAFIDGDHTQAGVTHDVTWAMRLVRAGGWVACHDYDEATCPGVRGALDALFPAGPSELVNTLFVVQVSA
jgi:predicted O-methyltransferase YrrM